MSHGRLFPILILVIAASLIAAPGCDDDSTNPEGFTIADFAGTWDVTQYRVTHTSNPQLTVDFIEEGATLFFVADASGAFTGEMEAFVEELQQTLTLPFAGQFELVDQQTVTVSFDSEIEPYLTGFTGTFTFENETITLTDDSATFDFDEDGTDEPVTAVVVLVRR